MSGWISLHRKLADNPLWLSEPFTRAQAWVDMILLTNHKTGFIYQRGVKVDIKRGELGWSQVALGKRWQWSRGKVKRFLNDMEKEQQIIQHNNNVSCLIAMINYNEYQGGSTANSTADGQQIVQQTVSKQYTNNNDNKENKDNKKTLPSPQEAKYLSFNKRYLEKLHESASNGHIPKQPASRKSDNKAWVDAIRRLETIDGYSWQEIIETVTYYFSTEIKEVEYKIEAFSMDAFRKKYTNIRNKMMKADRSPKELSMADRIKQKQGEL